MDTRFSVKEIELIFDCLIQSNGFMNFDQRGLGELQTKFATVMNEIAEMINSNNNPVMFFSVFMEHQKGKKKTENVFQELSEQTKEVMDLSQKIFQRNEVIYKEMNGKDLCQLNMEGQQAREKVVNATLDIMNISSFNLLMLQTIGRILSYIGYGLTEDELKTEQGKGGG